MVFSSIFGSALLVDRGSCSTILIACACSFSLRIWGASSSGLIFQAIETCLLPTIKPKTDGVAIDFVNIGDFINAKFPRTEQNRVCACAELPISGIHYCIQFLALSLGQFLDEFSRGFHDLLIIPEQFCSPTYHNLHYNNRLQLVDIRLGDSSTDEYTWTRGALVFYYGTAARDAFDPFANSADNNGNVLRQVNYVPLSGGGNVIPQLDDYAYDALNRVASMTEAQQNSSGTWTYNVTSQTFTYDRWGNRTSVTGQTSQSWSTTEAAATNRLKLTSGNVCTGTKAGLCYDAAGNLTFDNQLGSGGDRTYDAGGRIVTAAGGGTNKYVYDADGKRVRRQVGSAQYWQVYGIGGELVAEYQWDGTTATLQKEYGSGGGATIVAESATVVRWLVTDHLGTPRIIADQSGSLSGITRHDYFPFGEENLLGAQRVGNGYQVEGVRQKYTGYERDTETNLDYAQARYYANLQGRFTSVDPLHGSSVVADPQSWNRYAYVGNHPLTIIDPSGLIWAGLGGQFRWFSGDELDKNGNLLQKYIDAGWVAVTGAGNGASYSYPIGNTLYTLNPRGPNPDAYHGGTFYDYAGWEARPISDAVIADGSEVAGAFFGGGFGPLVSRMIGEVLVSLGGGITTLGLSEGVATSNSRSVRREHSS